MTDAAIDEAMHRMPAKWYAIDGAQLTKDLKQRRDGLQAFARKFYLHLADRVELRGTDRDDLATIQHFADGSLDVALAPLNADGGRSWRQLLPPGASRRRKRRRSASISTAATITWPRAGPERRHPRCACSAGRATTSSTTPGAGGPTSGTPRERTASGADRARAWTSTRGRTPPRDAQRPWLEAARLRPLDHAHARLDWEPNQAFIVGGGLLAHELGLPRLPVEEPGRAPTLVSAPAAICNVRGDLLWRVPAERVPLDDSDRPQGVGHRRPGTTSG